jgi:hypothetical protein
MYCRSAPISRPIGSPHCPARGCRNSRIVGYQGLSSRRVIHRQSAGSYISVHVGKPIAPARWATALSTDTTRSRFAITAAVSPKSVRSADRSGKPISLNTARSASGTGICNDTSRTPGMVANSRKPASAIDRRQSAELSLLPAHTRPTRTPSLPTRRASSARQCARRIGAAARYGIGVGMVESSVPNTQGMLASQQNAA